jgi:hypothetical protein
MALGGVRFIDNLLHSNMARSAASCSFCAPTTPHNMTFPWRSALRVDYGNVGADPFTAASLSPVNGHS